MKTAADYRRAELRRKLRRAEEKMARPQSCSRYQYWSDIARILRRTLREESHKRGERR